MRRLAALTLASTLSSCAAERAPAAGDGSSTDAAASTSPSSGSADGSAAEADTAGPTTPSTSEDGTDASQSSGDPSGDPTDGIECPPPRVGDDPPLPDWVSALPLWQWYPIPGTALSSVEPTPLPFGYGAAKISAWNGATLKREGSIYLVAMAGGHADYAGNEVDALRLSDAVPQWVELHAPTSADDVINEAQFYLDQRPSATHTYWASQFIDGLDRLIVIGSPGMGADALPAAPADWPYAYTNIYSASFAMCESEWDSPDHVQPLPDPSGDWTASLAAKHPVTGDIYYHRLGGPWYRLDAATLTWEDVSDNGGPHYAGAAIDGVRDRMLTVGSYDGDVPPSVRALDGSEIEAEFGGMGAAALTVSGYPGVLYDEACDMFLVGLNGSYDEENPDASTPIRLLAVDPETWEVTEPSTSGPTPLARPNGIFNALQYVPELRGIVLANRYAGDVFFMRTAP
jgi:hypothetical protein